MPSQYYLLRSGGSTVLRVLQTSSVLFQTNLELLTTNEQPLGNWALDGLCRSINSAHKHKIIKVILLFLGYRITFLYHLYIEVRRYIHCIYIEYVIIIIGVKVLVLLSKRRNFFNLGSHSCLLWNIATCSLYWIMLGYEIYMVFGFTL